MGKEQHARGSTGNRENVFSRFHRATVQQRGSKRKEKQKSIQPAGLVGRRIMAAQSWATYIRLGVTFKVRRDRGSWEWQSGGGAANGKTVSNQRILATPGHFQTLHSHKHS